MTCIVAIVIITLNVDGHYASLFVDDYGDIAYALDTAFPPLIAFIVWAVVTAVESGLRRGSKTPDPTEARPWLTREWSGLLAVSDHQAQGGR